LWHHYHCRKQCSYSGKPPTPTPFVPHTIVAGPQKGANAVSDKNLWKSFVSIFTKINFIPVNQMDQQITVVHVNKKDLSIYILLFGDNRCTFFLLSQIHILKSLSRVFGFRG
jgi:hypothetical protein